MTPTDLDTLIAKLKSPNAVITDLDPHVVAAGLEDLRNRMSHVEHAHLKVLASSRANDERLVGLENDFRAASKPIATSSRKRVDTATTLPVENQKEDRRTRNARAGYLRGRGRRRRAVQGAQEDRAQAKDVPAPARSSSKPAGWNPFAATQPAAPEPTPAHA